MTPTAAGALGPAGLSPTPGRVAILGAGPTGLDAALACVEAGWACTVYESAASVGGNVRAWSHVRMFTPWSMNLSRRMRVHLDAAGIAVPAGADYPTGHELAVRLLQPLATLPPLAGVVRTGTRVLGISRQGMLKHEHIGTPARSAVPFRLLLTDGSGGERVEHAELVLDCTGSYPRANAVGDGGIPAPGERCMADRIVRRIPDLPTDRDAWAGRVILLVGAGKSAQTAARDLADLVTAPPGTRLVWAVRQQAPDRGEVEADPLPGRQELVEVAARLRAGKVPGVQVRTGVVVEKVRPVGSGGEQVAVTLRSGDGRIEDVVADRVLALTGFLGDTSLYRQLQVHECYATAAPMDLSAALLAAAGDRPVDCLTQPSLGVDVLRVPEPNFFVLGIKSYGRKPTFLLHVGYEQVDQVIGAYPAPPSAPGPSEPAVP